MTSDAVEDAAAAGDMAMRAPTSTVAPPSPTDDDGAWAGTNVQEEGIDEPDTVKTREGLLITVVGDVLRMVDLTAPEPAEIGEADVGAGAQLLVDGDTALVLTAGANGMTTLLTAYDIGDPRSPSVREAIELDGSIVSARMVDGMVRLVTTTGGPTLDLVAPSSSRATETARRRNIEAIRATSIDDWLPRVRVRDSIGHTTRERALVGCSEVYLTEQPASTSMVNVVSVDLRGDSLEPTGGASVVGAGEHVYASHDNLYVTNPALDAGDATDIHKFAITGRAPATYRASGRVPGSVVDQFALSERDGDLRVAVTTAGGAAAADAPVSTAAATSPVPPPTVTTASQSSIVVLGENDGELGEIGRVDGLGRGEQIRSVRFLDEVGYVVTFRRTDPLYTVDLSDPSAPRVVGELKIPGYSSYLHPVGDGRLLGIGQDTTEGGQVVGLQVALFDVSDPAGPRQLAKRVLQGATSEAEGEHHAFLWAPDEGLAVLPVMDLGAPDWFAGAVGFSVSGDGIDERGRIVHPDGKALDGGGGAIERLVMVEDRLVALSATGLSMTDPATFAPLAWLLFD
jgi:uncharacterized secreted protein with C-terminal beta-propeller domain